VVNIHLRMELVRQVIASPVLWVTVDGSAPVLYSHVDPVKFYSNDSYTLFILFIIYYSCVN